MAFKESETLELKKSTSELKEAIISVSSILNKHQMGELYFGIKNDGTIVGQNVSEQTIRNISKSISDNIEPKIFPEITDEKLEGKSCILVNLRGRKVLTLPMVGLIFGLGMRINGSVQRNWKIFS
ncbi:MAG: ATP-binding protein [Desulfobacterales bacterium]|nr:ATP-binding protein [Desulfobacterales bacterium]